MTKLTIQKTVVRKYNRKTGEYDRHVDLFDKYRVVDDRMSQFGWRVLTIQGPKQTFILHSTVKGLQIVSPPKHDGEDARIESLPFFYCAPFGGCGRQIQGATAFALRGDVLIPYTVSGGCARPL